MRKTVFALLLVLLVVAVGMAQNSVEPAVDSFVRSEMERQHIPGISLAVVKDGKTMLVKGYGVANVEHNVPVKPETVFQSGSVGKQFTATAIMMLVEEGKIGLDEKIAKYFGEVPAAWQNITIRHLLTHTSGMTDYPDDFDFRRDYTEEELLKRAKEIPLAFGPGEKWQYSNLGFVTLGILIGKVTGKFYGDFLQERIFRPLGMKSSRIISEADIVPNRAAGYRLLKGELKNQSWVSPSLNTTADGSLYLTALDMIKWDSALNSDQLLKKPSLETMWSSATLNSGKATAYGFGWGVRSVNGRRVVEHGGAWQGFKSHIARFLDSRLSVIVFANLASANQTRIAHGVAAIIDPETKQRPIEDPDPAATNIFKELLQKVIEGTAGRNEFTPQVQTILFDQRDRLFDHVKTLGQIRSFQLLERSGGAEGTYNRFQVEYDAMTLSFAITRDKSGKITLFELHPE